MPKCEVRLFRIDDTVNMNGKRRMTANDDSNATNHNAGPPCKKSRYAVSLNRIDESSGLTESYWNFPNYYENSESTLFDMELDSIIKKTSDMNKFAIHHFDPTVFDIEDTVEETSDVEDERNSKN